MLNKRVQTEIDIFFAKLYRTPEEIRQVTSSAFTQCRRKISYSAFSNACSALVNYYYSHYNFKKYNGFRLVAIDGSIFTLPKTEETIAEFGENVLSKSGKWIKAQVSFATDVLNNICVDAEIGPYKESEQNLALVHLSRLGTNNLYLFDRGYFCLKILKKVVQSECQFCFRVQRNACREIIQFIKSNLKDTTAYIDVEGELIKVRLSKILLESGEEEYLITSLFDKKKITLSKLKLLYNLRWGVEEQYKDMKYSISIENFIGKTPNSIKQEFYANILTYNLSMMSCKSLIDKESNKTKKKYKYKTNKRAILAKVKQSFVKLFWDVEKVCQVLGSIVKSVTKESVPIRDGRKYARSKTIKAKRKIYRSYMPAV